MKQNPLLFLDIEIGNEKVGRIVLEVFMDSAPLAAENFRALCTGEHGLGKVNKKPLHYKGTIFHKAISQFIVQAGDCVNYDGTGGESIYGHDFEIESLEHKFDRPGLLGMATTKFNATNSQFFITTWQCETLNGVNGVIGEVRAGMDIVREIANTPTHNDRPILPCVIVNCGELLGGENWGLVENDESCDLFPPYPIDLALCNELSDWIGHKLEIIAVIKEAGNFYFKKNKFAEADQKYRKALRYVEWYDSTQPPEVKNHKIDSLQLNCKLNLTACKLITRKYRHALNLCNEVLKKDPENVKALYRRGQAYFGLNEYELALRDLKKAKDLKLGDENILKQLKRVYAAKSAYLVREKIQFSRMFN